MHTTPNPAPSDNKLTRYVAEFLCGRSAEDLPSDVMALGKKSILDGLGLALSGSVSKSGEYVRRHLPENLPANRSAARAAALLTANPTSLRSLTRCFRRGSKRHGTS